MHCLVLGSKGMLGSTLFRMLVAYGLPTSVFNKKILKPSDIPDLTEYDIVFNCIGAIPQKKPTLDQMIWANMVLPRLLCRKVNKLVHFSTDCVFSGLNNKHGFYSWDDSDWATDDYGWTKRNGEIFGNEKVLTIRTSIIGHRGPFGLLDWFLYGDHKLDSFGKKTVNGYVNHFWNGMTTNNLSSILINNINTVFCSYGLWQFGGEKVSKFELLKKIAEIYALDVLVLPVEQEATNSEVNKCLQSTDCACINYTMSLYNQIETMRDAERNWDK